MKIKRECIEIYQVDDEWCASLDNWFPLKVAPYSFNVGLKCYGNTEDEAIANLQESFDKLIEEICE